jgi:uncharacterized protein YgbK (DUF1537 family)
MIAVIADDLTGAAELAGIGLRYGLRTEVVTELNLETDADLLAISMDSRSMNKKAAIEKALATTAALAPLGPEIIFKKVDSALRGYVAEEIAAHLKVLDLDKALLVPANPVLGRKIVGGKYLLHDQPIHLSGFSKDPEFPITTSDVNQMISSDVLPVVVAKPGAHHPESGILIGEVNDIKDLHYWAKQQAKNVFLAGASGFFTAVLDRLIAPTKKEDKKTKAVPGTPSLYVCGSAFIQSIELINEIKMKGGPVSYLPVALTGSFHNEEQLIESWSGEVLSLLKSHGTAIIAIDPYSIDNRAVTAKQLRDITAACVHAVYKKTRINEMIIEGGSTASAVVSVLAFNRFLAAQEITHGVVRMKVAGTDTLYLTIKPGSYAWSKDIWTF